MNNLFCTLALFILFTSCQSNQDPTVSTFTSSSQPKNRNLDSIPQRSSLSDDNLKGKVRSCQITTIFYENDGSTYPVDLPDERKYDRNGNLTYAEYNDDDLYTAVVYHYNQFEQCTHSIQKLIDTKSKAVKNEITEVYTYKNGLLIETESSEHSNTYERTEFRYDSLNRLIVSNRQFLRDKTRMGTRKGEYMKYTHSYHDDHEKIKEEWTGFDDTYKTVTYNSQGDEVTRDSYTPKSAAGNTYKAKVVYEYDAVGNWIEAKIFSTMLTPDGDLIRKDAEPGWDLKYQKNRIIKYY